MPSSKRRADDLQKTLPENETPNSKRHQKIENKITEASQESVLDKLIIGIHKNILILSLLKTCIWVNVSTIYFSWLRNTWVLLIIIEIQ